MSEYINNSSQRKELLKHMLLELHKGEAPEQVQERVKSLLKQIPYNEVVEVEQELIAEGLPEQEILKFCDLHSAVLEGSLTGHDAPVPDGHPVDTFKKENREIANQLTINARAFVEENYSWSAAGQKLEKVILGGRV